jgi:hypothetical protein
VKVKTIKLGCRKFLPENVQISSKPVDYVDKSVHNPHFKPIPVWMKLWMCSYLSYLANRTCVFVVFSYINLKMLQNHFSNVIGMVTDPLQIADNIKENHT